MCISKCFTIVDIVWGNDDFQVVYVFSNETFLSYQGRSAFWSVSTLKQALFLRYRSEMKKKAWSNIFQSVSSGLFPRNNGVQVAGRNIIQGQLSKAVVSFQFSNVPPTLSCNAAPSSQEGNPDHALCYNGIKNKRENSSPIYWCSLCSEQKQ